MPEGPFQEGDAILRGEECRKHSREMLDAANSTESEQLKREFLLLATEWLKLASEIQKRARTA